MNAASVVCPMYYTDFGQIPSAQYGVIYADPPWAWHDQMRGYSMSAEDEYPTMRLRDIQALPVSSRCTTDAVCLMWAVSAMLPEALATLQAWGFRYKTVAFVWSKLTIAGKEAHTLGRWTLGNTEMCLLGVRGHPQRVARNVRQLIRAPRVGAGAGIHSRKPQEARDRIVTLMGDTPRLELFARGESADWDGFGNTPTVTF